MSYRRTHTKSRHGCVQCKRNKTKCDERKPCCARCLRTGAACSLSDLSASLIIIDASQSKISQIASATPEESAQVSSALAESSTVSRQRDPHRVGRDTVQDEAHFTIAERDRLRLMNHYATFTCKTITNLTFADQEGLSPWHEYVPRLAFEHDFLLHGLLGLSSLHLALTEQSSRQNHYFLAINHHNLGSILFRQQLGTITADNVDALFAFSCVVALHAFGIHHTFQSEMNPLTKIHEVLALVRGTSAIVANGLHWLKQGPWGIMFQSQATDPTQKLSLEIEHALTRLSARINLSAIAQSNVYTAAITTLRQNFILATKRPQAQMTMVLFPIMVHPEFLSLLSAGEPLALAIVANYGVILHWLKDNIWLEGWGVQVIDTVRQALPQDWHGCIAWAEEEMFRGVYEF